MTTFDLSSWVWMPDASNYSRPARVVGAAFRGGRSGVVETQDGMHHELDAKMTGDILPCDPADLSPKLDNLIKLKRLTEHAVLHNLRVRYSKNDIYTNVGDILVSLNPFQVLPLYNPQMLKSYKSAADKLPPHIFELANATYTGMLSNKVSQSVIISGESGAGKTEATKQILHFLAEASSTKHGEGKLEQQVLKANPVMEAFGNAKTVHNNNSSRFGKLVCVQFKPEGSIAGAHIINYLLEKSRVCTQSLEERNYHIFYQLLAGVAEDPQLQKALGLEEVEDYFYLFQEDGQTVSIDDVKDDELFEETWAAMEILQMGAEAQMSIFKTVAAVLHLGNAEFEEDKRADGTEASKLRYKDPVQKVAALIGLNQAKLELALVSHELGTSRESVYSVPHTVPQADDSRDALAKAIFAKMFDWIIMKINVSLASELDAGASKKSLGINVLDIFGFESFDHNSFEQLCINYCNEKLQFHFNEHVFKMEQEEFKREGIDLPNLTYDDNSTCLELLEKQHSGVFAMIDEEISIPRGSDDSFLNKLYRAHAKHKSLDRPPRKAKGSQECFVVVHYAGPVTYNVKGFLEKNKDALLDDLEKVLSESKMPFIKEILLAAEAAAGKSKNKGKKGGRMSSASRRPTLAAQFKRQLGDLLSTLGKTTPHFVRCIKPNAQKSPGLFEPQNVLRQLRYSGLVGVCQIRQMGYPVRMTYADFYKVYHFISPKKVPNGEQLVMQIQGEYLGLHDFALGDSKVFLRSHAADALQEVRRQMTQQKAAMIQAQARASAVRIQYTEQRAVRTGLAASVDTQQPAKIEAALQRCSVLPYGGTHLQEFKTASSMLGTLEQQGHINEELEDAIASGDIAQLQQVVRKAESARPPLKSKALDKAKRSIAKTEGFLSMVRDAMGKRDLPVLQELLAEAKDKGLEGHPQVADAAELSHQLSQEMSSVSRLRAVLDEAGEFENAGNADLLKRLTRELENCRSHGIEPGNRDVKEAENVKKTLTAKVKALRDLSVTARDAKDFHDLDELQQAYTVAVRSGVDKAHPDLQSAKKQIRALQDKVAEKEEGDREAEQSRREEELALKKREDERKARAAAVVEIETSIREAIKASDLVGLAAALTSAEDFGLLPSKSTTVRQGRAKLQQWEEKEDFERKVKSLEGRIQEAIDMHNEEALRALLEEADALGIGGDHELVRQGRILHEEWESEQQEWKDVLSQRTDMIKSIKIALKDEEVTIAQVEEAERHMQSAQGWLSEAATWAPKINERIKQIKLMRAATVGENVSLADVKRAADALEVDMHWAAAGAEVNRWRTQLDKRMGDIKVAEAATKQGGKVTADEIEEASDAIERMESWMADSRLQQWESKLEQRFQSISLLRAAMADEGVPAATVEGASALAEASSSWLADADEIKQGLNTRLEMLELFERAAMFDQVPVELLLKVGGMQADFLWTADQEAEHWRREAGRRLELVNLIRKGLKDTGVKPKEAEVALKCVDRVSSWLLGAEEWKTTLEDRVDEIALIQTAAEGSTENGYSEVQAAMVMQAHSLTAAELHWLDVPGDWMPALDNRVLTVEVLQNAAFGETVDATEVAKAGELLQLGQDWLVEAKIWSHPISERAELIQTVRAGLPDSGVSVEAAERACVAIRDAKGWCAQYEEWSAELGKQERILKLCKAAASTVDKVSAEDVASADAEIKDGALDWAAPDDVAAWVDEISERHHDADQVKMASMPSGVTAATVREAHQSVERILNWMADSGDIMAWRSTVAQRLKEIQILTAALATENVPAQAIEAARRVMADAFSWLAAAEEWEQVLMQRTDDISHVRAAIAANSVHAAVVEAAEESMQNCQTWLAEAAQWKEQLDERLCIVGQLRMLSQHDHVEAAAFDVADQLVGQPHSWLAEASQWKSNMLHRKKMLEFLKKAALEPNMPAAMIDHAKEEVMPEVQTWLAEASEWGEKLTFREDIVIVLRDAMADNAVAAETVERAGEVLPEALQWLQDAPAWKAKIAQRVDVVHKVKAAALDQSKVTTDQLQFAMKACRGGESWLRLDDTLTETLFARIEAAKTLKEAASSTSVTVEIVEAAHARIESAIAWLVEAIRWNDDIEYRFNVVQTLKASVADTNVSISHVEQAQSELVKAERWLVEARQWRRELGRRVNVNKLIKHATARNSAVTLAMIDRAHQELANGSMGHLSNQEQESFRGEVMKRQQDVACVRKACDFANVRAGDIEAATEPLQSLGEWMSDPQLRSWKVTVEQRLTVVTLLRTAVSDAVTVDQLLKAHKSVVGSKSWLVEAPEWEGVISNRVKDVKHVQQVAGLGDGSGRSTKHVAVRMDVVESVVAPAEAVVRYLEEASYWNRSVYQRLETVQTLRRATADEGVSHTEVEEAAHRLELASQWLAEAPQLKVVISERMKTLKIVQTAVAEYNVKPSDVEAAQGLLQVAS